MSGRFGRFSSLALGTWLLLLGHAPAQPPAPTAPRDGVLLLQNGQTVRGKISRAGDRYYVALNVGELNVKAADVQTVCTGLDEAYLYQRRLVEPDNLKGHLDLATWCLQNNLLGYAADEVADGMRIDAAHPKLALLKRRLELARVGKSRSEAPPPGVQPPKAEDLDRLARGLPSGTVETFANVVQPMLLNHCASCHGSASGQPPRLLRIPPSGVQGRRITQRNLHTALSLVDQDHPSESRLLKVASQPHGKAKTSVFGARQDEQFRQLADWVNQVCRRPPAEPAPLESVQTAGLTAPLMQRMTPHAAAARATRVVNPWPLATVEGKVAAGGPTSPWLDADGATTGGEAEADPAVEASESDDFDTATPGTQPKRSQGYTPIDPFDPEIFNRQFDSAVDP